VGEPRVAIEKLIEKDMMRHIDGESDRETEAARRQEGVGRGRARQRRGQRFGVLQLQLAKHERAVARARW
jgi:hypothetical protein